MIDVLTLTEEDTRLHRESVHEQAGPCPDPHCRCQTDGFRVKWNGKQWVFMCRGCWDAQDMLPNGRKRGWGDAIDYLRHYRGLSFKEAKALVEEQAESSPAPIPITKEGWESETWQHKVDKVMCVAVDAIWTSEGAIALDYARGRGLSDETIKQFKLGYDARDGIPRLLIPSMNEYRYVTIYRRDLRPDSTERWKDTPGGTKSELYLADCLRLRKDLPIVLVEDVFSALSIWQECNDLVNVVATGGATCGKLTRWLARLALASRVLIALDADEAGDTESDWWLERLENAQRLRPIISKDANDMLRAGLSLSEWIMPNKVTPCNFVSPEESWVKPWMYEAIKREQEAGIRERYAL